MTNKSRKLALCRQYLCYAISCMKKITNNYVSPIRWGDIMFFVGLSVCLYFQNRVHLMTVEPLDGFRKNTLPKGFTIVRRCAECRLDMLVQGHTSEIWCRMLIFRFHFISLAPLERFWNNLAEMFTIVRQRAQCRADVLVNTYEDTELPLVCGNSALTIFGVPLLQTLLKQKMAKCLFVFTTMVLNIQNLFS